MRVLSIDGGGIRGLIPALMLEELERRAERRVFELFDLIAGTSTGAILACALCAPDPLPAARVAALYEEEGPEIFSRSIFQRIRSADGLLDERYDSAALDGALARFLSDKRLSRTRPDLVVPAYDTAGPGPFFFKTIDAHESPEDDFPLSVVARASSAAPTYFEPSAVDGRALVDGGVFAANPAMSAFAEVLRFQPGAEVVLLSLGTGERTRRRTFDEIEDWGLLEWTTAARRGLRRDLGCRGLPAPPLARRGPLLALPGRADAGERRAGRRDRREPPRLARAGRGICYREERGPRRRDRAALRCRNRRRG